MRKDWNNLFSKINQKEYSRSLHDFLNREYASYTVYPPRDKMFTAFDKTNPNTLKAVIIGQDPYHEPGQAMGMSFSVPSGVALPPSLINIYKEIEKELGSSMNFENGDLSYLADQGVLLLNAYLSVRRGEALSHKCREYDLFLSDVLDYLDALGQPIVFLLWGGFARKYKSFVKNPNHYVLEAVHPSPLSANRGGWFGNGCFKKCNDILIEHGVSPIDWVNNYYRIR